MPIIVTDTHTGHADIASFAEISRIYKIKKDTLFIMRREKIHMFRNRYSIAFDFTTHKQNKGFRLNKNNCFKKQVQK